MKFVMRQIFAVMAFVVLLLGPATAQVSPSGDIKPEQVAPNGGLIGTENSELIHFGDLVNVDIVGSTEFDWRGRITAEGVLGGLGFTEQPIFALCRETGHVASEIQSEYKKFLNNPIVNVEILDRSNRPPATLYGAVRQPQRFRLMRNATLKELLVLAGGFSENAAGVIEIARLPHASCTIKREAPTDATDSSDRNPYKGETRYSTIAISDLLAGGANANPLVLYGDIITVLRANPIYVIGEVANPGPVSISDGLTISRAISAAGGISGKESNKSIRLFRRNPTGTDVIVVSTDVTSEVRADTFEVKEYDIIEVFGGGSSQVRYPPVLRNADSFDRRTDELPIRIVD